LAIIARVRPFFQNIPCEKCLLVGVSKRFGKLAGWKLHQHKAGLWIRIRIGSGFRDFVDPDPDPGARKLRNFSRKNALLSYF
jgi:hypothetical protein